MSRIPQNFIDDLLDRLDIVEVVDHRVKLKKAGKNYSACCPFHEEKTPSFSVSPDKQFYYCFGCGATGNAVGFVMEYDRQGFVESVEYLAKLAGMEVPREENREADIRQSQNKKLYEILEKAASYYQTQLKSHPNKQQPVQYLKNRGLTGTIAKDFGLGYAPPGWDNLLNRLGTNEEDQQLMVKSGMTVINEERQSTYDRFRHRITFPIRDIRGRTIGFGGRVLGNDKPKYLNSPETEVFHKGRELYGLYETRQANRQLENLLVVEGYMDVIALAQFNITNAVATLGTACGEEHLKLSFRYVNEVVFCFDGDEAGRTAAKRALINSLSTMEDGRQIKFLFLPEGQDPDSLVRQIGADRFKAQVQCATPLEEFLFDASAEGIDIQQMDGRAKFSKVAAPLIEKLPQGVFKELMFANLAKRTGLSSETLKELTQEEISLVPAAIPTLQTTENPDTTPHVQQDTPLEHTTSSKYPPRKKESRVTLTPVIAATSLVLEHPELLDNINTQPFIEQVDKDDPSDLQQLAELLSYLKKRPSANFNNILGYWGGKFGIEQQQKLAQLVASQQLLNSAKSVKNYNTKQELTNALQKINRQKKNSKIEAEINQLKSLGLQNLTKEQKNRLIELISAFNNHKKS